MAATRQAAASCLHISVSLSRIGTQRRARTHTRVAGEDSDEVLDRGEVLCGATDRTSVRASKRILQSPTLAAISSLDSEIKAYTRRWSTDSCLRAGLYLVPLGRVEAFTADLIAFRERRAALVAQFLDEYEALIEEARARLGPMFDRRDYRSRAYVERQFDFRWEWLSLSTPGELREISQAFFDSEVAKAHGRAVEVTEQCMAALRAGFQQIIHSLTSALQPSAPGKRRKAIKRDAVARLAEFIERFKALDIAGDGALARLTEQAAGILEGVLPEDLRKDEDLRDEIYTELTALAPAVQQLVEERPRRSVALDALDAEAAA